MIDYHLHVWPHEPGTPTPSIAQLTSYAEAAAALGIERIAITEHSHRFVQVDQALGTIWPQDALPLDAPLPRPLDSQVLR